MFKNTRVLLDSKYIYIHIEQRSPSTKEINTMVLGTLEKVIYIRVLS